MMATLPLSAVPHIDLTKALEPGTPQWEVTCQTIRRAVEAYGCFAVDCNEVTWEEKEKMFAEMESLLTLPMETKKKVEQLPKSVLRSPEQNPETPLHRAIGVFDAQMPETVQALTDLMWPHGNHKFCQTANSMNKEMEGLALKLTKMVLHSYGLDRYCDSQLDDIKTFFLMAKYSAPATNEPAAGIAEHVDLSFLTVLLQNDMDGLVCKCRNGEWVPLSPGKSSFIVVAGLLLKVLSNGRLYVPPHKVILSERKERYSCALFLVAANKNPIVETPHEVVDEEHPLRYKPFVLEEFRNYYLDHKYAEDTLDKFAGI